jgi:hypothetical protein
MEIVKAEQFGIGESKAKELTQGLGPIKLERKALIERYHELSKAEINEENIPKFRELRIAIRDNRTKGINVWHKTNKEFFLTGGKFVDAIKNKEILVNEVMEAKLSEAENHFENLEKEKIAQIQKERVELISRYVEHAEHRDWTNFDKDEFKAVLDSKIKAHEEEIAAEKKAEEERIEKERLEAKRIKEIETQNKKLQQEAEEKAKQDKIEADGRAKEKQEQEAKLESERKLAEKELQKERDRAAEIERKETEKRKLLEAQIKAKEQEEADKKKAEEELLQKELNAGDKEKRSKLTLSLEELKSKYDFKSKKNQKMYANVQELLTKVVNYIDQN